MPLWLIGLLLKARSVAGAFMRVQLTLPLWVWTVVFLIGIAHATSVSIDAKRSRKALAAVQKTIDAPVTGWKARLQDCRTGRQTLIDGQQLQNRAMTQRSNEATATLKANTKALDATKPRVAERQRQAATLLKPLVGADVCQRMFEVDQRFVETLRR